MCQQGLFDKTVTQNNAFRTIPKSLPQTLQNLFKSLIVRLINHISDLLKYAEKLFSNNVPVIYNTSHLASLVGYRKEYLKRAAVYTNSYYRNFNIKKKNGKNRLISEPLPSLKDIQIWILENILSNVEISPFAKAYRKGVGLWDNLKFHKDQPKLFTIDISNFFTSIKIHSIQQIFSDLGYSSFISNLLARLCTKDHCLPQGAPTSPYLSNIFFRATDKKISEYCVANKIKYTRYADDLSFSGDFDEKPLKSLINQYIGELGLQINDSKTRVMLPNSRQIVTGIVVNKIPQVPFCKRNKLRQNIYFIKKFGIKNHIKHEGITQSNYIEHLLGQVSFILHINPKDEEFKSYQRYLKSLIIKQL